MTTNYLQGYLQSGNTQFEKCNNITYLSNYKVFFLVRYPC